jgi:hypothetical protein
LPYPVLPFSASLLPSFFLLPKNKYSINAQDLALVVLVIQAAGSGPEAAVAKFALGSSVEFGLLLAS